MKLAAIICNYNGKDYVINCINSLLEQTYQDFDIILVDNASTDGTCEEVESLFGTRVLIHKNSENLGGTGGFNTGLEKCVQEGYDYILMLDNDVRLAVDTVEELFNKMQDEPQIGILGCKIKIMYAPEHIQEYGSWINKDKCEIDLGYYFMYDKALPEIVYCDYVPACVAMVRTEVIKKVGVMPKDNFIYWDDIEFCYNIRQAGYKVAALGSANAWHRGGYGRQVVSTFGAYYYTRNRIDYFLKTTDAENKKTVCETLIANIFQYIYGSYYKKMDKVAESRIYALVDGFKGVRGKQADKVFSYTYDDDRLAKKLGDKVIVYPVAFKEIDKMPNIVNSVVGKLKLMGAKAEYIISLEKAGCSLESYRKHLYVSGDEVASTDIVEQVMDDTGEVSVLEVYDHVIDVKEYNPQYFYVDKFINCIISEKDFSYFSNYQKREEEFVQWFLNEIENETVCYEKVRDKIVRLIELEDV